MVAHTGFLLSARRLADDQTPLQLKKREKVSEASTEDRAAWPGERWKDDPDSEEEWDPTALKTRVISGKKTRKTAAYAQKIADQAKEVPRDE